jgi:hypothetical protein
MITCNFETLNNPAMKFFALPLLLISFGSYAQCKTYKLTQNRDTVNCTDMKDLKQGKWVVKVEGLRGEPGYEEEGIFKDNKKEGMWRVYTTMGDLFGIERYRWGNKDGISQYFNIAGLVREESWKAVNPDNPYDTIEVPDPIDPYKVEMKVVKIEGSSVKHGNWKYYESGSGSLVKTDSYFLDKLEDPLKKFAQANTSEASGDSSNVKKPVAKTKPAAVLEFEKKNSGKKKVKVIDGRTF